MTSLTSDIEYFDISNDVLNSFDYIFLLLKVLIFLPIFLSL